MLDSILDWSVVALPTVAGIAGWLMPVTERKPRHRYWLALTGVALSSLIYFQQHRSRTAHANETKSVGDKMGEIRRETDKLRVQADQLRLEQQVEVARRKQAEHDLTIIIESSGKSTRSGVVDDIRKSPITVNVNGQPTAQVTIEKRRIREALAQYMQQGIALRERCKADDPASNLESEANVWFGEVQKYLITNLDASFLSQFVADRPSAFSPGGVPQKRVPLWLGINNRVEQLNKFIDQQR